MSFGDIDDDDDALDNPAEDSSVLDSIKENQARLKAAAVRTVALRDPSQPEYELLCEVPTDGNAIIRLQKRAEEVAESPNAPDAAIVANCMILARYTRQLRVRGRDATADSSGSVFTDKKLQASIGAPNAWRAVRQLFIVEGGGCDDGVSTRLTNALMAEGGLGRGSSVVVDEADPT
jgi:hypothetical protein